MTINPFSGFKSLETHHCVTGSMIHIFEYNNCFLTEDMLLGLGAGIGFIYWHMKGTLPFFGGRANTGRPGEEGMERAACRRLGVDVELIQTGSIRKAEKNLLGFLEAEQPVMMQVDMGYLPYFDFGGQDYHFGGHLVVAAGYDSETRLVLIADRDLKFHPVPWEALENARGSTYKPFPPKNRLYRYDFSNFHAPDPSEILAAIREAAEPMVNPPITNLGVKGIRKSAKRVLKWTETMDVEMLKMACFNVFIFIDAAGGTGGGIFRYMYGRFLKEAAEITGLDELSAIGDEFMILGDRWQEVAKTFKRGFKLDDPSEILLQTTKPLLEIADLEEDVWKQLFEIV